MNGPDFKDTRPLDPPEPGHPVDSMIAVYDQTYKPAQWEIRFEEDTQEKP